MILNLNTWYRGSRFEITCTKQASLRSLALQDDTKKPLPLLNLLDLPIYYILLLAFLVHLSSRQKYVKFYIISMAIKKAGCFYQRYTRHLEGAAIHWDPLLFIYGLTCLKSNVTVWTYFFLSLSKYFYLSLQYSWYNNFITTWLKVFKEVTIQEDFE